MADPEIILVEESKHDFDKLSSLEVPYYVECFTATAKWVRWHVEKPD
jgi:hypothetical protein